MRSLAVVACVLLTLVACGSGEEPALEGPPAETEATAEAKEVRDRPSVTITEPEDGDTLQAGDVQVAVEVENFELVEPRDRVREGQGHLHFYLDLDELPTRSDRPAVTEDKTTYHVSSTTSHTWEDVERGEHTFGVQLVENNHFPLERPATDKVTVTVE